MNTIAEVAPLSDLKNRQREILAQLAKGPVILTEHGRGAAVLLSMQEWQLISEQLRTLEDTQALRSLYAEFDVEERMLAESGLGHYAHLLKEDEDRT
jgi:prevent-host-death family protein